MRKITIREEYDVRPDLEAGVFGKRLRDRLINETIVRYGEMSNVTVRQKYPKAVVVGHQTRP